MNGVKRYFLPVLSGFLILASAVMLLSLSGCSPATEEEILSSSEPLEALDESPTPDELSGEVNFANADYATSADGEVLIQIDPNAPGVPGNAGMAYRSDKGPDEVWNGSEGSLVGSDGFTLPEAVAMEDGSLGTLQIPAIGLTVSVYETEDNELEAMVHGVAHFKETSCWDGNVGLAGHNQGVNTFFQDLYKLKNGDKIILTTALGTRTYEVTMSKEIDETDWSYLDRTDDNRITLITCVNHDLTKRLCVQGVEVE